ncbi:phosphoglucosamine mutase [Gallibacter intestinalis]|uniref:Phosphoglucosamine mutase n=1 Tax=Gallibacter intestinalis TaxID=2779356 RepID=A0ABR9QUY7_9FIRM|nr:phosphoglucosamine mutase [Gallibacter intestinalis]MBE5034686.1 phosphoglucosamine mutase [Gallibacter intestinalis]
MGRLFGTDGVRGVANSELTPELAFSLGKAGAYVLSKESEKKPTFLIGMDTRISGDMLENALSAGILAVGGDVIKVGVLPTPAIAHLVKHYDADAGIVISASHNPYEYNGIKFFNSEGFKLDDSIEEEIEDIILRQIDVNSHITHDQIGKCREADDNALDIYVKFLESTADFTLKGRKIVLDCANGAAYQAARMVYDRLGANTVTIGVNPNGTNINDGCGSTHPELLQEAVIREGAFIGLAYDGDADRLIAVDEKGRIIDGDKLICICAKMLKEEGRLAKNLVTGTVMSNIGFHKYLKDMGCETRATDVGDRYVLEDMLKTGGIIGGEQSGHIIFLDKTTTGDGILSSIQLVRAVLKSGKNASELSDEIKIYPQVLVNAKVTNENKKRYTEDEEVVKAFDEVSAKLGDTGRLLVRPSGTEPLVRVMIEGEDTESITEMAEELADMLSKKFGC